MKTKLTLLLVLAVAGSLQAQKPNFNQAPGTPVAKAPVAPPRSIPSYHMPSLPAGIPRNVLPRAVPNMTPRPMPPPPPRVSTVRPVKPGVTAPRVILPAKKTITRNPGPTKPAAALNGKNTAAIREGAQIAEGLRSLDEIRKAFPDALRDKYGFQDNPKDSTNGFQMPFDHEGNPTREFKPREVTGPRGHHTNRSGLTDIRGEKGRSQRGLSHEVVSNPDGTTTEVLKRHNSDSQVIQQDRTTRDQNGTITRVEQTEVNDAGVVTSHRADRTADGDYAHSTTTTRPDGTGNVGSVWRSSDPWFCDRTPGDIAVGGPVNGTGPGVGDVAGLVPLDLLRQHANGEQPSGGANTMTSGRLNRNHTNPAAHDNAGSLPSTANRNTVPVDNGNLAGPTGGGNDRPD